MRRTLVLFGAFLLTGQGLLAQVAQPMPVVKMPAALERASVISPQPTELAEKLVTFDPNKVELAWLSQGWQLRVQDELLKDFGRREKDARDALRLIRELRLNQRGTVGYPNVVMEYWLSNGAPPQALSTGHRTLSINPERLRVERTNAQWCLRDDNQVLFNFGFQAEDARLALNVIRRYGFSQVTMLNPTAPSMMVFLANHRDQLQAGLPRLERKSPLRDPSRPRDEDAKKTTAPKTLMDPSESLNAIVRPTVQPLQSGPGWQTKTRTGPPPLNDNVQRIPFDWRTVQVRKDRGEWVIGAGSQILGRFGNNEREAKHAVDAVRYYRLTEQMQVGRDDQPFAFYLANGQAPQGLMLGLQAQPFAPDHLKVQQVGQRWSLTVGDQVIVPVSTRQEDAQKLLGEIRRLRFDRVARIGTPSEEGMTLLLKSR